MGACRATQPPNRRAHSIERPPIVGPAPRAARADLGEKTLYECCIRHRAAPQMEMPRACDARALCAAAASHPADEAPSIHHLRRAPCARRAAPRAPHRPARRTPLRAHESTRARAPTARRAGTPAASRSCPPSAAAPCTPTRAQTAPTAFARRPPPS